MNQKTNEISKITNRIFTIRGAKVMLDRDLAGLYCVETRVLKQAVRRNVDRFPVDFMFELSQEEFKNWRSQIVISKSDKMGLRHPPMAFTEQGVAMLSSVLRSEQAIKVNIQIMRAFVQLRHIAIEHADLKREVEALRQQTEDRFQIVFEVLDKLVGNNEDEDNKKIGFINDPEAKHLSPS